MDRNKQTDTENLFGFELDEDFHSKDYKYLLQKLKSINERIHLLEKNFFDK